MTVSTKSAYHQSYETLSFFCYIILGVFFKKSASMKGRGTASSRPIASSVFWLRLVFIINIFYCRFHEQVNLLSSSKVCTHKQKPVRYG